MTQGKVLCVLCGT